MDTNHLAVMVRQAAVRNAERPATRVKVGDTWVTQSYGEFYAGIRRLAAHLLRVGVAPGDRIVMFARNSPEWSTADFAALSVRAVPVPIYSTSTPDDIMHIVNDSGATMAFLGNQSEVDRFVEVWPQMPALSRVVTFDKCVCADDRVQWLQDFVAGDVDEETVDVCLAEASADELATIIYTSGTTGKPKGAMLGHRGFSFQVTVLNDMYHIKPEDHSLCFLPLSHALERAWSFVVFANGCLNTYVPDTRKVAESLAEIQPTLFVSVPYFYEKVFAAARAKVADSPQRQKIFEWALRVGGQCQRAYRKGKQPAAYWRAQLPLADKLVLKNIRHALGGPKTVMACGGAPLRREIEEFISAAGLLVCNGYGLTEASPLVSFNAPSAFKFGTCGQVVAGGEIRIGEDGEIWYRGPNVMKGYWGQPEATAATITDEGWLRTGDVGYVDVDGYLVITDRIKDIIVTSGGKNIAPQAIEGLVMTDPLFEHAVVLGDNRPYLTMLVKPSLAGIEELARKLQVQVRHGEDLFAHPAIVDEIKSRVTGMTSRLAQHEQIKDLRVLIDNFTQENGLLTPTLKIKRKEVEKRFASLIDDMYAKLSNLRKGDSAQDRQPAAE